MNKIYKILLLLFAAINFQAQYCVPAFSSGCAGGDQIDSFSISAANFSDLSTGCSTGAYGDFTAQTITLQAGVSYDFTVTHNYNGQRVRIWVDLDNNMAFDDTLELVGSGVSASVGGVDTTNNTITVPATTAPGTYRIRVADRWLSDPIPCNTAGYGEAHDYTLQVTAAPSCLQPSNVVASNVTSESADVSYTAPPTVPANGYEYYRSINSTPPIATTAPTGSTTGTTVNFTGLTPSTQYYFWVRSVCSSTENSSWSSAVTFTTVTFCPVVTAPANNAEGISTTPTITWDAVPGATGYKITVGTTAGGTDVLNNVDVGNVLAYTFSTALAFSTKHFYTVNAYSPSITTSLNCTERNFTTICDTIVPTTYTNDFSSVPGTCWNRGGGGSVATGPANTTGALWRELSFLQGFGTGAVGINLYTTNRAGWLITPTFDVSAGGYTMSFDYGVTEYDDSTPSAMGSDDVVEILMSVDGGATWTSIKTFNAASNVPNTSTTYTYPITSTSNNVKFAMFGTDGTVDDSEDYEFYVDNFQISNVLATSETLASNSNLTIAPNPITDVVRISDVKDVVSISIVDLSGRIVKTVKPAREINLGDLKTGMYLIQMKMKDGSLQTVKAIKK